MKSILRASRCPNVFGASLRAPVAAALLGFAAASVPAGSATAFAVTVADERLQHLEDFVHFAIIAKPELAAAYGQRLLDSSLSDGELAELLEGSSIGLQRFDEAMARALLRPELEDVAAELGLRIENGRMELARQSHRIDQAIDMLIGTQRERLLGERRLAAAGEYAVPALLRRVTGSRDQRLRVACIGMIRQIGRAAVTPLVVALPMIDAESQRVVCELLGDIRYDHAAPALRELMLSEAAPTSVRDAAGRAYRQLLSGELPLSVLYTDLARRYFEDTQSLVAYPFEATNNVWRYDTHVGLIGTEVPTVVFGQIMAMRSAARAVEFDPAADDAIALYVAANLRRDRLLPADAEDPIYGDSPYTPEFYATVFGPRIGQRVLSLAIDRRDTPLVRSAIAALSETTGGANLFPESAEVRRPLVEALRYPDRRVQYDAALTLARALPDFSFDGMQRVVPLLASAVRLGDQSFAVVVASDEENRMVESTRLRNLGYTVVSTESSAAAISAGISDVPGIDLIVVRMEGVEAAREAIRTIQRTPRILATPVLIVATPLDAVALTRDYSANMLVSVTRPVSDEGHRLVIEELVQRASGGRITESEGEIYAIESLSALRDIAISGGGIYNLLDSEGALLDALDARRGGVRMLVAEILALMGTDASQQKLFAAAIAASGGEQISLLERVAISVRRSGNRAERRHVLAIIDLVDNSSGALAEAAGRVHGALDLGGTDAVRLIRP